jgi:cell division protein FtsQ
MGSRISEIDVSDRDNLRISEPYEGASVTLLLGDRNFAVRYKNFVTHYAEIKRRLPGATTLDLRLEDRITVVE